MTELSIRENRKYAYDILINIFEPFIRSYTIDQILTPKYGESWRENIPQGVLQDLAEFKNFSKIDEISIEDFFDELNFPHLKAIILFSDHYKFTKPIFGELNNEKFNEIMDDLNQLRRKIAHGKSFSTFDLIETIENVRILSQGDSGKEITRYLDNESYKNGREIPPDFFEPFECQNNLPEEYYDLDGGFVGREREIKQIKKFILSDQDRIITITGTGGVGKTAIAIKIGYSFLSDPKNPFEAVIWFSAKSTRLTDDGIVPLIPGIRDNDQLIRDILDIIDSKTLDTFKKGKVSTDIYKNYLYGIFSSQKCLVIIDNLETIIKNDSIIEFIKEIPRPSQVLITSRKGLGEIERRIPITDMVEKDAIKLFRVVAKERNRDDLVKLPNDTILTLVKSVHCYPLLIKWSIGQVCLGRDMQSAFSQIFKGESEIAKFSFDDVFKLISEKSRMILYGMIIFGQEWVSKYVLQHLAAVSDDEIEDSIKELVLTSFLIPRTREKEGTREIITEYSMLSLTRGFIENKLDDEESKKTQLLTRYNDLQRILQNIEASETNYYQSFFSLGLKTPEDKVAFHYISLAKNCLYSNDTEGAEQNFEQALKISPNSAYVLIEASKFEFIIKKHIPQALVYAKRAIELDPKNFQTWLSYGITLRFTSKYDEAIECFIKAKELNPEYPPISTELGKAYMYNGKFEEASIEFNNALIEEKYPNYRNKILNLQLLSENYRRWADVYWRRNDYHGQLEKLGQSKDKIQEAIEIARTDRKLWKSYREIFKDIGVALSQSEGFASGKPYLLKSIESFQFNNIRFVPDPSILSQVYYYLAFLSLKEPEKDIQQINEWISLGLKNCPAGSKYYEKLNQLKNEMTSQNITRDLKHRKLGKIKFFDHNRRFGIVEFENSTCIFFPSSFPNWMNYDSLLDINGRSVSFAPIKDKQKEDGWIAKEMKFED